MPSLPDQQLLRDVYAAGRRHISQHVASEHILDPTARYLFRNDAMLENPFGLSTVVEKGVGNVACTLFSLVGDASTEISFQTTIYRSGLRPEPALTRADVAIPIMRPEWQKLAPSKRVAARREVVEELHVAHHEAEHAGILATTPVLSEEAEMVRDILQGATFYKFLASGSLVNELKKP